MDVDVEVVAKAVDGACEGEFVFGAVVIVGLAFVVGISVSVLEQDLRIKEAKSDSIASIPVTIGMGIN